MESFCFTLHAPLSAEAIHWMQVGALSAQGLIVLLKLYSMLVLRSPGSAFFVGAMMLMLTRRVTALSNVDGSTVAELDAALLPLMISVILLCGVLTLFISELKQHIRREQLQADSSKPKEAGKAV